MSAKTVVRVLAHLLFVAGFAAAQSLGAAEFPVKPINLIVPFGPGGPTDIVARSVAEQASQGFSERIVVMNKPGASATLGSGEVFRAKPDGYTILLADNISTVLQPKRMKLAYQGAHDFQPIIKLADIPNVLVVQADSKWRTLNDFVKAAKAQPGTLRVSTAGRYTGTDLNMLEFNKVAGVDTTTVPVSGGTGESVTLLLGGHVEAIVAAPAAVVSHVQAGKLRPLAVFSTKRIDLFPEAPSTHELGFKTTMRVMVFISGPKGLDKAALNALHATLEKAVKSPKFVEFARRTGYQLDPLGPQALGKELEDWGTYFAGLVQELKIPAAQ
jgi:tripartite-type tricarboxylate transporter receptor subunit TctC